MSTITITLPDELKALVEQQSSQQGYESVSDYFQDMIRTIQGINGLAVDDVNDMVPDQELDAYLKRPDVRKSLEVKLLEGLDSPGEVADEAFWESQLQALRDKYPNIDFDADVP
jgi:Arc/MetJ-type ribon-helix-helix transcriptional regulator